MTQMDSKLKYIKDKRKALKCMLQLSYSSMSIYEAGYAIMGPTFGMAIVFHISMTAVTRVIIQLMLSTELRGSSHRYECLDVLHIPVPYRLRNLFHIYI